MYAGTFVESGTADEVFAAPRHPYTLGLLQSVPRLDVGRRQPLQPIPGSPRNMLSAPSSCPFAPRCRYRDRTLRRRAAACSSGSTPGSARRASTRLHADEWRRTRLGGEAA